MNSDADVAAKKARLYEKLQAAVRLELATLPPYLTALWSIHPGTNQDSSTIIRSVLMEEMLHMTLAANVLSAVGGHVNLGGEALPAYPLTLEFDSPRDGERTLKLHLERFSRTAVHQFMDVELPQDLPAPPGRAPGTAVAIPGFTIGQFYAGIVADLRTLCDEIGSTALFCGNPSHQISEEFFWKGGGRPIVVTDLEHAELALNVISMQGEGADGSLFDGDRHFFGQPEEVAHYFRFNQICAGRYYAPSDSIHEPPSGAALPVSFDAVYPIKPDCRHSDFAADSALSALSSKFNAAYSMMLWQLMEGFDGNPAVFYTAIMNGMSGLSEVARAMVSTPIPGDAQRRNASPTFEWNSAGFGLPAS